MKLDPQAEAVLQRVANSKLPQYWQLSAPEARKLYRDTRGVLASPAPDVAHVEDLLMPGPGGAVALRYYRPSGSQRDEPLPVLVFFHGGGWTIGDLDTHDIVCRGLANAGLCAVVSVDYRLAPEHKFPAAVDDATAATHWVHANAARLVLDASRLAVGGDSAGGNLAAAVAITFRDTWAPELKLQLLIYPAVDFTLSTESHRQLAEGYLLTRKSIDWFTANYLRGADDAKDWRASPLFANDHSRLAPAYIFTAGYDPLRDEGHAYADKLHAAGVSVTYECFEGMIHGFIGMGGVIAAANHAIYRAGQGLRAAFATATPSQKAALHR
jgi:acetyl esterase